MKDSFYIGETVIGIDIMSNRDITGMIGVIVGISDDTGAAYVEFDKPQRWMHDCGGHAKPGHGWNCMPWTIAHYCDASEYDGLPSVTELLV